MLPTFFSHFIHIHHTFWTLVQQGAPAATCLASGFVFLLRLGKARTHSEFGLLFCTHLA